MRQKKTRRSLLPQQAVVLCIAACAACITAVAYGPSLFGQLPFSTGSSGQTEGEKEAEKEEEEEKEQEREQEQKGGAGSKQSVSGQTASAASSKKTPTGDCILQISTCSSTEVQCPEAPVFIRSHCSDPRCMNPLIVCSPVPVAGTTTGKNAAEEAQTAVKNEGSNRQGSRASLPVVVSGNSQRLGCYDRNGIWTTDRSACAENQSLFLQLQAKERSSAGSTSSKSSGSSDMRSSESSARQAPIEADEEDEDLQRAFQTIFPAQPDTSDRASALLQAATNAQERLRVLRSLPLTPAIAASVDDASTWVSHLLGTLTSQNLTEEDIASQAALLRDRLEMTTQNVVATSVPQARPSGVVASLDAFFAKLPVVFAFMQEQGAAVNVHVAATYQSALTLYKTTRAACMEHAGKCPELANVLARLETLRSEISLMLKESGKSDLESRIDALLQ